MPWNPLFAGYYGMQNTGDDVFCVIAAWGAKRYWDARHVRFAASCLPVMPKLLASPAPRAIYSRKPHLRGYAYSLTTIICRLWNLCRSSCLVYAGGSVLSSVSYAKVILQATARFMGRPHAGIGLSIGPFDTPQDRRRVTSFLRQFSFLSLRDRASLAEARSMSLPYRPVRAFDLAGLLPAVYGPRHPTRADAHERILGLGLGHSAPYEATKERRIIETLVRLVERENIRIRCCVFGGHPRHGDLGLAQRVTTAIGARCPVEIIPYTPNPEQMWTRVAECDAFLAERLHSAIFAYMARVPFASVEYHRKCCDLAEDIGLPDIYRFPSSGPDPDTAAETLSNMLHNPQYAEMAPQEATALAELNFTRTPWSKERTHLRCA